MTLLGFRDPHAFAKDQVLGLGLEDQEDQPLYDGIDTLTRDQASYLRLLLVGHTDSNEVIRTTKEQFHIYLEAAQQFYVVPENTTLMQ
ncbi:MAG: hypothetical protein PHU93_00705 [Candidatus Gracilibacteria bacterium]|nr:hypothetical protein [Candidatus Gracilibacteria bacterium]